LNTVYDISKNRVGCTVAYQLSKERGTKRKSSDKDKPCVSR